MILSMILAFSFVIGACIGSFINVACYRIPIMLGINSLYPSHNGIAQKKWVDGFNLCTPRSHCLHCKKTINFYFNIPIFSYLFLKGKCFFCKNIIPKRYLIIELLTAVLYCLSVYLVLFSYCKHQDYNEYHQILMLTNFSLIFSQQITLNLLLIILASWIFITLIIIIAIIDFDTLYIPDELNYLLIWIGLLINLFNINSYTNSQYINTYNSYLDKNISNIYTDSITKQGVFCTIEYAVLGAVCGYMFLWLLHHIFKFFTKKDGIGFGDFKLLAGILAWVGVDKIFYILLLASLIGIAYAMVLRIINKTNIHNNSLTQINIKQEEQSHNERLSHDAIMNESMHQNYKDENNITKYNYAGSQLIPFGPFLGLAGIILLFTVLVS